MEKFKHTTIEGKLGPEIYVEDSKQGGYTAFFSDFPEIVSEGETIEEAQNNLWNAIYDVIKHFLKSK